MSPGNKPELRGTFKEVLTLASQWKTIGILLRLPEHVPDQIRSDEEGVNNQLQKMIYYNITVAETDGPFDFAFMEGPSRCHGEC